MASFVSKTLHVENPDALLKSIDLTNFSDFMDFSEGECVSRQRGRTVTYFRLNDRGFYLKRNYFNGREFIKCLLHLRWPPRNALCEWENIQTIRDAGIATVNPVAVGETRVLGIELASFIVIEELYGAKPLEKVIQEESTEDPTGARQRWKRSLIREVARMARRMHTAGMCHQDFYLGHIFLNGAGDLYLIDLQRVRRYRKVPRRYIVKDLGQLNFSADLTGKFSRADRMRFLLCYLGVESLKPQEKRLARSIMAKTERITRHTVKLLRRRRQRGELR